MHFFHFIKQATIIIFVDTFWFEQIRIYETLKEVYTILTQF